MWKPTSHFVEFDGLGTKCEDWLSLPQCVSMRGVEVFAYELSIPALGAVHLPKPRVFQFVAKSLYLAMRQIEDDRRRGEEDEPGDNFEPTRRDFLQATHP